MYIMMQTKLNLSTDLVEDKLAESPLQEQTAVAADIVDELEKVLQ